MFKNPIANAAAALVYITVVVLCMQFTQRFDVPENTILVPIAMLSLFTFSAALMGYIFIGTPLQMYLDGQKKEAVSFFLKTLGTFAAMTLALLLIVLITLR